MHDHTSLLLASLFTLLAACVDAPPPGAAPPSQLRDEIVGTPGGELPSSPCADCRLVRDRDAATETTLVIEHDAELCRIVIALDDRRVLVDTCTRLLE